MGFKASAKKFQFVWPEDNPLHGLEVTASALTSGEWDDLRDETRASKDVWESQAIENRWFIERVTRWNLEGDDGSPLPVEVESLRVLGRPQVVEVVATWIKQSLGIEVPVPLDDGSNPGEPSVEQLGLLPTESM